MLDAAQFPVESNICLSLLKGPGSENDRKLVNAAVGAEINLFGTPALAAAQAAREAAMLPTRFSRQRAASWTTVCGPGPPSRAGSRGRLYGSRIAERPRRGVRSQLVDFDGAANLFVSDQPDAKAEALLNGLQARGVKSVFVRYLRTLNGTRPPMPFSPRWRRRWRGSL